jgi:hypothetical protein
MAKSASTAARRRIFKSLGNAVMVEFTAKLFVEGG